MRLIATCPRPIRTSIAAIATALTLALILSGCGGGVSAAAGSSRNQAAQASLDPARVTLTPGQSATFTAHFTGAVPASIAWTASGGTVAGSSTSGSFVAGNSPGTFEVHATAGGASPIRATATVVIGATASPSSASTSSTASSSSRLLPNAQWLYSAPTGTGINISGMVAGLSVSVNTHNGGFDYPVVYTDGSHGCTTFTDTLIYPYQTDRYCVPNPPNGYYPAFGGWGADDGHLIVVDTSTGKYYDLWKLYTDGAGHPSSTNLGGLVEGSLSGNGTPGTTAANITGLAGDIMPGELDCATCLNHALNVVVPGSMNSTQVGHQAPASKTDGSVPGAIFREGAKIRFDPSSDVTKLGVSVPVEAILRALQLYGGVITDQTDANAIEIYSSLVQQPDLTGLDQLKQHLLIYY